MSLMRVEGVATDHLSKRYHGLSRADQIALRRLVSKLVEGESKLTKPDIDLLKLPQYGESK